MICPDAAIGRTRVFFALCRVYDRDGRCTVRAIAAETGRSLSTVQAHLYGLRRSGLVTWERGQRGTLRPLYWPTDVTPPRAAALWMNRSRQLVGHVG